MRNCLEDERYLSESQSREPESAFGVTRVAGLLPEKAEGLGGAQVGEIVGIASSLPVIPI